LAPNRAIRHSETFKQVALRFSYYLVIVLPSLPATAYTLKAVNLDSREGLAKFCKIFFEDVILNIELTWSQFDHQCKELMVVDRSGDAIAAPSESGCKKHHDPYSLCICV